MKLFHCSPSKLSIFCASSAVPSVQVTSACVSPRVNTHDPCVRGSTPASIQIGRISSNLGPTRRTPEGPVLPGQHAGLDPNRADLVELASVEAHVVLEDFVAEHLFLQL